jgi:IS30 family transposase
LHSEERESLLNVVDVYSRFAWVFPIKTKSPKEITPHIRSVLEEIKQFPMLTFTSDEGNEFLAVLPELVENYNNSYHVSIKDTPSNIFKHPENKKFFFDLTKPSFK